MFRIYQSRGWSEKRCGRLRSESPLVWVGTKSGSLEFVCIAHRSWALGQKRLGRSSATYCTTPNERISGGPYSSGRCDCWIITWDPHFLFILSPHLLLSLLCLGNSPKRSTLPVDHPIPYQNAMLIRLGCWSVLGAHVRHSLQVEAPALLAVPKSDVQPQIGKRSPSSKNS